MLYPAHNDIQSDDSAQAAYYVRDRLLEACEYPLTDSDREALENELYEMAQRYMGSKRCSLLTFGVKGGFEAGKRCFNALRLFKRMVNMGDAKSLACHPASTTHRQLTPEEQVKVGVTPEMIRLSVGIEHIDDIIADLEQALEKSKQEVSEGIAISVGGM